MFSKKSDSFPDFFQGIQMEINGLHNSFLCRLKGSGKSSRSKFLAVSFPLLTFFFEAEREDNVRGRFHRQCFTPLS